MKVQATAIRPLIQNPVSAPLADRPIISPPDSDAALDPSCCIAELKLRKDPRSGACAAPVMMAVAGIKRPDTNIMNITITMTATHNGAGGKLVTSNSGMIDMQEMIMNILSLPWRSDMRPQSLAVKTVASPPKK